MPCLIVGTQTDLRDDPAVKDKLAKQKMQPVRKEDGEKMARELGAIKYVECSALTQYKLKDVFDEVYIEAKCKLRSILLTHFHRQLLLRWNRQLRRRRRAKAVPFCKRQELAFGGSLWSFGVYDCGLEIICVTLGSKHLDGFNKDIVLILLHDSSRDLFQVATSRFVSSDAFVLDFRSLAYLLHPKSY